MIFLNHVKIISLVKSKKEYTFQVETDKGEILRIRINPDGTLPAREDYDRLAIATQIAKLQNRIVDLIVQPVQWVIGSMSDTSLILHEIKQV